MHIFCMFQPPLSKNTWFTLFVGQELVRHMHFLGSPRSGKTWIFPGQMHVFCMFQPPLKMHVAACCCMLLHVSSISSIFQGYIQKNMHFPRQNIMSGGIEPSKNACCRMHVARGALLTLWLFPSPPLGPTPAVTGLVSMELPAHRHMYVEQPSQRTLKVAHSLWCNIIPSYK